MSNDENTPKILILPEDWYCFACGIRLSAEEQDRKICDDCDKERSDMIRQLNEQAEKYKESGPFKQYFNN